MKLHLSDLWTWQGSIDRASYAVWGAILVAVKFNIDRLVMRLVFDRDWAPSSYFSAIAPTEGAVRQGVFAHESIILLLIGLPFLWTGVALSLRRLQAAGLPRGLVALFVVPWIKWVLFATLVTAPNTIKGDEPATIPGQPRGTWLDGLIPRDGWAAATVAVFVATTFALTGMLLGVWMWEDYGWSLFVGVPFISGFVAALLHGHHQSRSFTACVAVAGSTAVIAALATLLFAFEGIICLAMAAPIAGVIAVMGGAAGFAVQLARQRWKTARIGGSALAAVPLLFAAENWQHASAPLLEVSSTIYIEAPPETVWRHVIAFAELPPPTEWLFRIGLAYPTRASIDGTGAGAIRRCEFSTGAFIEPITVWDEPHLLAFTVTHNPPPMQEWTFYDEIHPPHLNGFLVSDCGEFQLIRLDRDRTRLTGTTWYRHNMQPARYWQLWSDYIIHHIHLRVLRHVKDLAESETKVAAVAINTAP